MDHHRAAFVELNCILGWQNLKICADQNLTEFEGLHFIDLLHQECISVLYNFLKHANVYRHSTTKLL